MFSGSIRTTADFTHPRGILTQLAGFRFRPESLLQFSSLLHSLIYSPQLYPPNCSATMLGVHISTSMYGNTQETSLPAFAQIAASTAAATLPLFLIFISAVVQVISSTYFQSFSKGADELLGEVQYYSRELQHSVLEVMKKIFYLGLATRN